MQDKSVRLWNPHTGKHIKKFAGCHNQEVNDVLTLGFTRLVTCGHTPLNAPYAYDRHVELPEAVAKL